MSTVDRVPRVEDDGLPCLDAGAWALEKYDRVQYYGDLFTTAMKDKWDELVYIDLFAGPGYARLGEQDELVPGSPLLALGLDNQFDRYIFCEKNPEFVRALKSRVDREHPDATVEIIPGDVNENVDRIHSHIPDYGPDYGVLSFCFSDPFDLAPRFETMRRLTEDRKMDVMHIMPVAVDGRRNFYQTYIKDESDKVDQYLGNPDWREDWREAELRGDRKIARFLARQYVDSMADIGYIEPDLKNFHTVKAGHVALYYIGFFGKHRLGYDFWKKANRNTETQLAMDL